MLPYFQFDCKKIWPGFGIVHPKIKNLQLISLYKHDFSIASKEIQPQNFLNYLFTT